jgi:hypothetical protein
MTPYFVFFTSDVIPETLTRPKSIPIDVDISRCRSAEAIMRCIENAIQSKLGISETIVIQVVYPLK